MARLTNVSKLKRADDPKTLQGLLEKSGTTALRDPYVLFDWDASEGGNFQAGYAIIYPGCRTGGHHHEDVEEVYHVVSGSGVMHIGDESFEVNSGDTWIVPLHLEHWTENLGNRPLEVFWILVKV